MKMKTSSQLKRLDTEHHARHRRQARLLASARLTAGITILVITLASAEPAADQATFCHNTAQAALTSCRRAAESDYWVAWGKCDNLLDPDARASCRNQVSADL